VTPTCPACGAKFSHDSAGMMCRKCGLPDEIRTAGPQAVARWKRNPVRREVAVSESGLVSTTIIGTGQSKAERRRERKRKAHPASANRRRNKHGRSNART
jgi:threonine synthase